MAFIQTEFPGLIIFEPAVWEDERGYFFESYNHQLFEKAGLSYQFVQDNESRSSFGVLRGLHYQLAPYAQAKLVRVLEGEVLDVVVDLRKGSPTYGKSFSITLSGENKKQLMIPRGFAHGFIVKSPQAVFFYKCDNYYSKEHETGIIYNDKSLNIDWELKEEELIISPKDKVLPGFEEAPNNFSMNDETPELAPREHFN